MFANLWLALGALGGAIPIIIHLLNRRRFKIVRWAAMEFLLASLKKNYRRIQMQNWLLLLLRALLIVLMALALARPKLAPSAVAGALGTKSRHVVLVLDTSMSMRYRRGQESCFDRAKAIASSILRSLNKGDVVSLVRVSDTAVPVVREATVDVELVEREIARAEPGWGGTDLRAGLAAAGELLATSRKPSKEVYLLTDMQAAGWGKPDQAPSDELKAALERMRKTAKAFVVDVGAERPENTAVVGIVPTSKTLGVGAATEFEVTVANFGRSARQGLQINFLIDKFGQNSQAVDVAPGESTTVTFSHTFRTPGARLVQATIGEDRLRADDVRHLAVQIEEFLPVLLINGEPAERASDSETFYLERALRPPAPLGAVLASHVKPKTITEFDVAAVNFESYRMVVLANLASLAAEDTVRRLEDYVRNGGSLVVFPGDRVDTRFYNQQLFRDGDGLLPARLGNEVGSLGEDPTPVRLDLVQPIYEPFRRFTGERAIYIRQHVLFYRYLELELPDRREDLRVVATFDSGSPAIVEKPFGRGRVLLFASTADTEWNNFARMPAFLVVMQDLVGHLAASDYEQRNVLVGEPYRRTFSPEELVETVVVRPPGEQAPEVTLKPFLRAAPEPKPGEPPRPTYTELIFDETGTAGAYELELLRSDGVKRPIEYVAANPPPGESRVDRATAAQVRRMLPGFTFTLADSSSELNVAVRAARTGRELARPLLWAVLALACVELVLGRVFGR
jgi:Mg-chelatase subunit ChlD